MKGDRWKIKIHDGYVCRIVNAAMGNTRGRIAFRDWWFGKKDFNVTIKTLPQEYWGKHIRIRIEVDKEWEQKNVDTKI